MCGIIGVVGADNVLDLMLQGLTRLDYRGYDSAGVVLQADGELWRARRAGKLTNLLEAIDDAPRAVSTGMGHTRWATHGGPTEQNAHPHTNKTGRIAVVHNGIVENYLELAKEIAEHGDTRASETDSEVLAHLISYRRAEGMTLAEAVRHTMARVEGSYSVVVTDADTPDILIAARDGSPLIAGANDTTGFVASDIPAILGEAKDIFVISDGQVVEVTAGSIRVTDLSGTELEAQRRNIDWSLEIAEKEGFEDFMLKEIHEQPTAVRETLRGRVTAESSITMDIVGMTDEDFRHFNKVVIVACGTSYHAGLAAKFAIERWARVPVEVDIASEFRYRDPILDHQTLVIAISQSGETKDTIEAANEAKLMGAKVLALSNIVDSSLAREADASLYTRAGLEVGVAATKTQLAQIVALQVFASHFARIRDAISTSEFHLALSALRKLPDLVERTLKTTDVVKEIADDEQISSARDFFFLGRGVGFAVALEGALKLKEISYLRAEGYAGGELKHGPIALLEPGTVVVGIATQTPLLPKLLSNVAEVKARGASVILIVNEGDEETASLGDYSIEVPKTHELLTPIIDVIPLQLLAYSIAKARGLDVDKPRNLAKTVTVE